MSPPAAQVGYCIDCDYPLPDSGSPACPECGRTFDARTRGSMHSAVPGRFARWMMKPIGWPFHLLVLTAAACGVYANSAFEHQPDAQIASWLLWYAAGAVWLTRPFIMMIWHGRFGRRADFRRVWHRWVLAPMILLLAVAAVEADMPRRVRVMFSLGALEQIALDETKPVGRGWWRLGFLEFVDVKRNADESVYFRLPYQVICSPDLIVFAPDSSAIHRDPDFAGRAQHLYRDWYFIHNRRF